MSTPSHDPSEADMAPGDEAPPETPLAGEDVCPRCGGSGALPDGGECPECAGAGYVGEEGEGGGGGEGEKRGGGGGARRGTAIPFLGRCSHRPRMSGASRPAEGA